MIRDRVQAPVFGAALLALVALAAIPEHPDTRSLVAISNEHYAAFRLDAAAVTLEVAIATWRYDADTRDYLILRAAMIRELAERVADATDPWHPADFRRRQRAVAITLDTALGGAHRDRLDRRSRP